jgi:hypothetical protein
MPALIDLGCIRMVTRQTFPNSVMLEGQKIVEGNIRYRASELDQNPDFIKVEDPL